MAKAWMPPPTLRRAHRPALVTAAATAAAGREESSKVPTKGEMLKFYGPALGIFMASPLMSNIDNAIIGRAAGVSSLAALSPGTVLSDQVLFLFSFLSRATTGLVSRANAAEGIEGARRELRRPLAAAFAIGAGILVPMYLLATPRILAYLRVSPELRPAAASYARIRGVAAPLALCQSVALSSLLALRDAATPLKVVLVAAILNLVGDLALCVWPFQLGVSGAAAATSLSTGIGAAMMLRALRKRNLLDDQSPTWWWRDYLRPRRISAVKNELGPLFSYAGPLSAIVVTRLLGFAGMQITVSTFGTQHLAAYQIALNVFVLFAFFAEPLSQTAQAVCPPLVDSRDSAALKKTITNLAVLAGTIGPVVAAACAISLKLGAPLMTSDPKVVEIVSSAIPALFATVLQLFITGTLDGCIVGARDFKWIVMTGSCTCLLQLAALRAIATSRLNFGLATIAPLALVFTTFTARLLLYAAASATRVALGFGPLGGALRHKKRSQKSSRVSPSPETS